MKKINCILLVDDNETDNEFHISRILKSGVCDNVKVAEDGQKGLEYIHKAIQDDTEYPKPDIIFLDINMPKVNGFEFLEEYHKLADGMKSKTIIIMLSTSLNPDDRAKALKYKEVGEFQYKPLTIDVIKEISEKYF
ncbi:MAG TPA: response regulator [Lentimicrobium sp.]|jgi:CheY-like chemotaxis protein|nr:response regulator [Lentimicrobium sp.]